MMKQERAHRVPDTGSPTPTVIDMEDVRCSYLVHAELYGAADVPVDMGQTQAGHPVARRINRINRAALTYDGRVVRRGADTVLATFKTPRAAVLCACEMQRRCDVLPSLSGHRLGLRIGIHYGPARQRATDAPGAAEEITAWLASTLPNDGVVASGIVMDGLSPQLRELASAMNAVPGHVPAYELDWRHSLFVAESGGGSAWAASCRQAPAGESMLLRYASRELSFGIDQTIITIGRGSGSDVLLTDKNASRKHCRLIQQLNGCALVDVSTNGTHITPDQGPAFILSQEVIVLRGSGRITFGRAYSDEVQDVLEFGVFAD